MGRAQTILERSMEVMNRDPRMVKELKYWDQIKNMARIMPRKINEGKFVCF